MNRALRRDEEVDIDDKTTAVVKRQRRLAVLAAWIELGRHRLAKKVADQRLGREADSNRAAAIH